MSVKCTRCVLSSNVPRVTVAADGVCNVCREYDDSKVVYDAYFGTEADLRRLVAKATARQPSDFDCLLLYSGGKDSTYVLYKLIDLGYRVLTLTFDNGYIPAACFRNIEQVCRELGVDNVIARVAKEKMDQVFVESLREQSTVCSGCFRALTARSTELAIQRDIPVVVTGLSRGQIFATKVHQLLRIGVTDVDRIDRTLREFRSCYHAANDAIAVLVDDRALADAAAFDATQFVDFYRYCPATKREIVALLSERAPFWRKPANVGGCSTNCLINDVGIHVHLQSRGYHNYAVPLAWDVRFGHLTRDEALQELTSEPDPAKVERLLHAIGYLGTAD